MAFDFSRPHQQLYSVASVCRLSVCLSVSLRRYVLWLNAEVVNIKVSDYWCHWRTWCL